MLGFQCSFYLHHQGFYPISLFDNNVCSWQLTIISFMLFSLLSVGISTLLAQVREASFEKSKASRRFTSVALEFINGIRTVFIRRRTLSADAFLNV